MVNKNIKTALEIDELKKRLGALAKNVAHLTKQQPEGMLQQIEQIKTNILNLQAQADAATTNFEQLSLQVEDVTLQLQQILDNGGGQENLATVATTGDYLDLENRPDKLFEMGASFKAGFNQIWGITSHAYQSKLIWFTNALDTEIEGKVSFGYIASRRITSVDEQIDFKLNNTVLNSLKVMNFSTSETKAEFTFKFRPKQSLNNFSFFLSKNPDIVGEYYLTFFNIEISYGKNVFFLNRDWNRQAFVYQDKYIIYSNKYPYSSYFIKDKDNFDFSTGETFIDQRVGRDLITFFHPKYVNGATNVEINKNLVWFLGLDSDKMYPLVTMRTATASYIEGTKQQCQAYSISYFREFAENETCPSVCYILGQEGKLVYWENSVGGQNSWFDFNLNGQQVQTGIWIDVSSVNKQDMSNIGFEGFKGCVATKYTGECVFFPHFNASYTVNLGFGRRVNAFYQDDQSINVYLGRVNHVVKKVLVKNLQTGQYELDESQQQSFYGYDELVETLDNCFIGITPTSVELVPY